MAYNLIPSFPSFFPSLVWRKLSLAKASAEQRKKDMDDYDGSTSTSIEVNGHTKKLKFTPKELEIALKNCNYHQY